MLLTNHVESRENKKDKDIFTNVFTKEQVFWSNFIKKNDFIYLLKTRFLQFYLHKY